MSAIRLRRAFEEPGSISSTSAATCCRYCLDDAPIERSRLSRVSRERAPTKTLYDVLGVRPDDDAEEFKRAFRIAVKASHPDVHAGDPDAQIRFRQVVKAYAILRDPEQRAAYDQLLALEREQLRAPPRRYTLGKFVFDGIAAGSLAVAMAVGYVQFADILPSVSTAKVVTAPWRGPAKITTVEPAAPTDTTAQQGEPRDKLPDVEVTNTATASSGAASTEGALASATKSGDGLRSGHGGPASSAARPDGPDISVATIVDAFGAAVDQAHAKAAADHLKSYSAIEPLDQKQDRSVGVQPSVKRLTGVPRPRGFARSEATYGIKARDMVAKQKAAHPAPSRRVSLENRSASACPGSQSCSRDVPPVFGVGF